MSEEVVLRAVHAFMAKDIDGILAVADEEIVLRSLLTEAERPLYYGHEGVRGGSTTCSASFRTGCRGRGRRAWTRTAPWWSAST